MNKQTFNFEQSYARLEEILEKMNSGTISLEQSLSLYEEADKLMKECMNYLSQAEQKIEIMLKDREKKVLVDEAGDPQTEAFQTDHAQLISRDLEN